MSDKRIIYKKTDGVISIIIPAPEALESMTIEQIAQKDVKEPKKAQDIFNEFLKKGAESILLQVYEGEFSRFLVLKLN